MKAAWTIISVIRAILDTGVAGDFIRAVAATIRSFSVARLYIGDIFDRAPIRIWADKLIAFHDVTSNGATTPIMDRRCHGNEAMIANVMRQGINYNTYDLLEDGYEPPPFMFADSTYRDDPCEFSCLRTV